MMSSARHRDHARPRTGCGPTAAGPALGRAARRFVVLLTAAGLVGCAQPRPLDARTASRSYNGPYTGPHLGHVVFPLGGIGAGMLGLEGTGAFSNVSVRNRPEVFNEPCMFAALSVAGRPDAARVLEGPVPKWKAFGVPGAGNGRGENHFGLPRFRAASFLDRFPFAAVTLTDPGNPLAVELTGWSPFVPGAADDSSLPVAALEYRFTNPTDAAVDAVFSFHAKNFMATGDKHDAILAAPGGFTLWQPGSDAQPANRGAFRVTTDQAGVVVDHAWFRGGWFDALTMVWKGVREGRYAARPPLAEPSPGASLFVPFRLAPGADTTVRVLLCWHVPVTELRIPDDRAEKAQEPAPATGPAAPLTHVPWYAGRFADIDALASYWREHYDTLRRDSALFRDCFYDTTLPPEVVEAVAANLAILKTPTVLRQTDGRLWCFEGCSDGGGCCHGTCTHVWNYAQALPHLFPDLERTLRQTEFNECQDERGHQTFRAGLPIRPVQHDFHAASDGQLGGIMKVYRDWRISGDTPWLRGLWPRVRQSLDYGIATWDPRGTGTLEEPHHNTYDIEFWGPDAMCTGFYLGALHAAVRMGTALGDDVGRYQELLARGRAALEANLFNGEYFMQRIRWEGLNAEYQPLSDPDAAPEAVALAKAEGPKYQYGNGCLSDAVLGLWLAQMSGLGPIVDEAKVRSTLRAIYRYNFKSDLSTHANPQRPAYALGDEGGLLLCTWPKGDALSLPFVYSNEVWTGIEYQVASHLALEGMVDEALQIVRACRDRYDGTVRNPFDEYECGHWYARALGQLRAAAGPDRRPLRRGRADAGYRLAPRRHVPRVLRRRHRLRHHRPGPR